jgi:hypothetical protein
VQKNGQCICRDGSSGGQSGGSGSAAGLTGQNCCPTGRHFNPNTNKCDPDNAGKPHVTIVKTKPDSCTLISNDGQVSVYQCTFTITLTNDGTAPANIPPVVDTPSAGTIVGTQSDGSWNCGVSNNTATCQRPSALAAGGTTTFTVTLEQKSYNYGPDSGAIRGGGDGPTEAQNCAEIQTSGLLQPGPTINPGLFGGVGDLAQSLKSCDRIRLPRNPKDPPPVTTCTPTRMPACSGPLAGPESNQSRLCHSGECDCTGPLAGPEGNQKHLCRAGECMTTCPASAAPPLPPPPPPPPTITVTCPQGTVLMNNQCFFIDPGCRGPDCRPVFVGCPGGAQRNSDGNCPTSSGCAGGVARNSDGNCPTTTDCGTFKKLVNGKCVCLRGVGDDCHIPEDKTEKKKKKKKPAQNSSDNPPAQSGPTFQIQIGPGFGGGGPRGGGRPGGGGNRPSGGGLNRSPG